MSLDSNLQLVSYLVTAETYNNGKSILDCLKPIVESTILSNIEKDSISFLDLQNKLESIYHLSVPKVTLKYFLNHLQNEGEIKFIKSKLVVPCKEKLNIEFLNKRSERETDINDLFIEFNNYLINHGIKCEFNLIKENCCNWLYMNSLALAKFIKNGELKVNESSWNYQDKLIDFLLMLQTEKSSLFDTFLRLYNGAIQATLLNFDIDEITGICENKMKFSNIILDTNFILRVLNLQSEFDVSIARDTLAFLKVSKTKFFILEQTLNEIINSITYFLKESKAYIQYNKYLNKNIRTTGFLNALNRGVYRTEFLNLRTKENLKKAIIDIFGVSEVNFVDNFDDSLISDDITNELVRDINRDGYTEKQAKHDLSLITFCKKSRKNRINSIFEVDWWVLTNDEKLTFWNQNQCDVFQECLTEIQISNLAWIQKEKKTNTGLMQTVVSLSSAKAVTNKEIKDLAQKIHEFGLKNKEKPENLDKASILFYDNMLSIDDIMKINYEEGCLENIIEEKVSNYQEKQQEEQEKTKSAEMEKLKLLTKLEEMKKEKSLADAKMKQDAIKYSIESSEKELINKKDELNKISKIKKFQKDKECSTCRYTILIIIGIVLLLIFIYFKGIHPFVVRKIKDLSTIEDTYKNIIVTILSILVPAAVCFIVFVGLTFLIGKPTGIKDVYNLTYNKLIKRRTKKFMDKELISIEYLNRNNDIYINNLETEIKTFEKNINVNKNDLNKIEEQIRQIIASSVSALQVC